MVFQSPLISIQEYSLRVSHPYDVYFQALERCTQDLSRTLTVGAHLLLWATVSSHHGVKWVVPACSAGYRSVVGGPDNKIAA